MTDLAEALERWTSDFIMNYVSLLGGKSTITRKGDRIDFIRAKMLNPDTLRQMWAKFDPITQRAISDAYYNDGIFDSAAFEAQYGELPPRPRNAFLLGQADTYEPTAPRKKDLFTIDEERHLMLLADLLPNEHLQLETMCEKVDERTMRLDQEKLLTAVESGIPFEQLSGFLRGNHRGPLPDPIEQWLARLENQIGLFRQGGDAVVIKLRRKELRVLVEEDEIRSGLCYPIDQRRVVVMAGSVTRFRNRLKELGYLLR